MRRTIRRGFPESVVLQNANAVDAAALQPTSSSDNNSSDDEHSSSSATPTSKRPAIKVVSVYESLPCQPITPSGAERGLDDPRIGDTTDVLPLEAPSHA